MLSDLFAARDFRRDHWPFGPPFPQVYRFVFVTSANCTDRGQNRNIEVGVLLDDAALAAVVEPQFSPAPWCVEEAGT